MFATCLNVFNVCSDSTPAFLLCFSIVDPVSDSHRIKQLAPPASVTTLSGAHAKPKAAVTPAEACGSSLRQTMHHDKTERDKHTTRV